MKFLLHKIWEWTSPSQFFKGVFAEVRKYHIHGRQSLEFGLDRKMRSGLVLLLLMRNSCFIDLYCFSSLTLKCKKLFLATTIGCANCFCLYTSVSRVGILLKNARPAALSHIQSNCFASTVLKWHDSKEIWKKLSKMWKNRFRLPLPMESLTTSKARAGRQNMQYLHISKPNRNILSWVVWWDSLIRQRKAFEEQLAGQCWQSLFGPFWVFLFCVAKKRISAWDQLQPSLAAGPIWDPKCAGF